MEAHYMALRERGEAEAYRRTALVKQLNVTILWDMDESTSLIAARLKAGHRISLADAIITAFALRTDAVLMHKAPEFDALAGLAPMDALPYKSSMDSPRGDRHVGMLRTRRPQSLPQ